ncbi:MAG: hypothetical protein WBV23_02210 [Desulfobaccales bacterium]
MPLALVIILAVGISLLVPLALVIIPSVGIPSLVPLAPMIITSILIPALVPLALMIIPSIGIPLLVPLPVAAIPAVGIAPGLLPLTVLAIPTIGIATRRLPLMRLAENIATRLGRGESLAIRLRRKGTIRSGLGAQRAQGHKQTHRENHAPPSLRAHIIFLLKIILHSGFINLDGRPPEKVNEFSPIFKNSWLALRP